MYKVSQLTHNGNLVKQAEESLNSLLCGKTNTFLSIENPDGTVVRLQHGFKINHLEIVGTGKINENDMALYYKAFSKMNEKVI